MAFLPTDLSNLKLWFKADGTLWTNTARTTPVSNGSGVGSWDDASGLSNHAQEAVLQPTYVTGVQNGLPIVRFGSAAQLSFLSALADASRYVFVVAKLGDTTNNFRNILNCNKFAYFYKLSGTTIGIGREGASDECNYAISDVGSSVFRCHTGKVDLSSGTATQMWLNGTSKATASTGSSGGTVRNGFNLQFNKFTGDVGEVIVYDALLSTSDRLLVETYLMSKWGFPNPTILPHLDNVMTGGFQNLGL